MASEQKLGKVAAFDIDGTLASSTVVGPLFYFVFHSSRAFNPIWWVKTAFRAIWWLWLEKVAHDRSAFNVSFYRSYKGWSVKKIKRLSDRWRYDVFYSKVFDQASDELAARKGEGYDIVFVTGGLDFLFKPIADYIGAHLIAASLEIRDGKFTGRLVGGPLAGERKAQLLREYAQEHGVSLAKSCAYGDSSGDAPMMAACGEACAVNPSKGLRKIAKEKGWRVLKFTHSKD